MEKSRSTKKSCIKRLDNKCNLNFDDSFVVYFRDLIHLQRVKAMRQNLLNLKRLKNFWSVNGNKEVSFLWSKPAISIVSTMQKSSIRIQ